MTDERGSTKNRRRPSFVVPTACAFALFVLLGSYCWTRANAQEELNRDLVEAAERGNPADVTDLLRRGANPNARPMSRYEGLVDRIRDLFSRPASIPSPYESATWRLEAEQQRKAGLEGLKDQGSRVSVAQRATFEKDLAMANIRIVALKVVVEELRGAGAR